MIHPSIWITIPCLLPPNLHRHHHHDPVDPHHDHGHHADYQRVDYHLGKGCSQRRIRSSARPPSSLDGRYKQLFQLRAAVLATSSWQPSPRQLLQAASPSLSLLCLCSWLTYSTDTCFKVVLCLCLCFKRKIKDKVLRKFYESRPPPRPTLHPWTAMPIAYAALKYILLSSNALSGMLAQ